MKLTKITGGFLLIILCFGSWLLFSGYGNTKNHPTLNTFMVNHFLSKNNKGEFSMKKFKNYDFNFERGKLKGDFITVPGLFYPNDIKGFAQEVAFWLSEYVYGQAIFTEEVREKTPLEWISHGGFSADVPEVHASFRHFYDPTRPAGKRHLTDDVNGRLLNWIQSKFENPETDGVMWAVGEKGSYGVYEHNYTWENGKVYFIRALEEANPEKRRESMAKAWRSLGETLHMVADNGCPSHVRNEAHPSIPMPVISYFGNPDTYEEMMDEFQKSNDKGLDKFLKGTVDPALASKFEKAETIQDLAHQMALFTNENFFTGETISGTDWKGNDIKPIAHPDYVYSSPKISAGNYSKNYYRRTVGKQEMLLCTDTWFFSDYPVYKTYPYLDQACVESQAMVLVPAIREAGMHAIRLFIPALTVKITSLQDDGTISGEVIHHTDKEYKQPIRYNGQVSVKTAVLNELGVLSAKNGKFSGKIRMEEGATIHAEIDLGGIIVKSDKITLKTKPKEKKAAASTHKIDFRIYMHVTYTSGYKDDNQSFPAQGYFLYETHTFTSMFGGFQVPAGGGSFSGKFSTSTREGTIEGERTNDRIVILKAHLYEKLVKANGNQLIREEWTDIELQNIPVDEISTGEYGITYHRDGWDCDKVAPDPAFQKSIVKLTQRVKFHPSGEEISISSLNFSQSEENACKNWKNLNIPRSYITVKVAYNNNL